MPHKKKLFSLFVFLFVLIAVQAHSQQKQFNLKGIYLEGCTCEVVCSCDLKGEMAKGCQVMGAMIISSGFYGNSKLSDVKIAFAVGDKWVRIYVQLKDSAQRKVASEMAQAFLSAYGTVESIRDAEIDLSGSVGNFSLKVDNGKVIQLETQPILGADGKTAVTYINYPDPLFHTIRQGKVITGNFKDGNRNFKLSGTNSFFNQDWSVSGEM